MLKTVDIIVQELLHGCNGTDGPTDSNYIFIAAIVDVDDPTAKYGYYKCI